MRARAIATLLLIAVTGWAATPALASVECRAMPAQVKAACPPSCPHCKKAPTSSGPELKADCCTVRAAPVLPPAEPHARSLHLPEVAVAAPPVVFEASWAARLVPPALPRFAPLPPPLQINRPLLR